MNERDALVDPRALLALHQGTGSPVELFELFAGDEHLSEREFRRCIGGVFDR